MQKIKWTKRALRQLKKNVASSDRSRVVCAAEKLRAMPNCSNVKALKDRDGYRLRVGNYRVIFDWFTGIRIVEILEVKRRNEDTY